jgi:hypothetical protein
MPSGSILLRHSGAGGRTARSLRSTVPTAVRSVGPGAREVPRQVSGREPVHAVPAGDLSVRLPAGSMLSLGREMRLAGPGELPAPRCQRKVRDMRPELREMRQRRVRVHLSGSSDVLSGSVPELLRQRLRQVNGAVRPGVSRGPNLLREGRP